MNTYKTNNDMTQATNTAISQHTQPATSTSSISDYYPPCASCLRLLKYLYQQAPWYILVPLPYSL